MNCVQCCKDTYHHADYCFEALLQLHSTVRLLLKADDEGRTGDLKYHISQLGLIFQSDRDLAQERVDHPETSLLGQNMGIGLNYVIDHSGQYHFKTLRGGE